MSRFLKLTSYVINTQLIRHVKIEPTKFEIKFVDEKYEGFWILGSGNIQSYDSYINVCEKENPKDYKIVSEWINNL
jgi:hypothetical protein